MASKGTIKKIRKDIKGLPLWLQYLVAITTVLSFLYIISLGRSVYTVFVPQQAPVASVADSLNLGSATSTIDISDILAKALSYDTVVERQDFLTGYIGEQVRGWGIVKQISRVGGGGFLVDLTERVTGRMLTCEQEETDENEKQLLLLKGKVVSFTGVFPFVEYYGHGLGIDNCVLLK